MNAGERPEQRHQQRFPHSAELRAKKLVSLGTPRGKAWAVIRGRIQNISEGGVCLLSKGSIPEPALVRCEIAVPGTRAVIPTVMQVRWNRRTSLTDGYKIGLQFIV